MFILKDINLIYNFMKSIKDKGHFCFIEHNEILDKFSLVCEFDIDSYDYMCKFIKDWLIFHSSIVSSYVIETNSDIVHFNIFLKERY